MNSSQAQLKIADSENEEDEDCLFFETQRDRGHTFEKSRRTRDEIISPAINGRTSVCVKKKEKKRSQIRSSSHAASISTDQNTLEF